MKIALAARTLKGLTGASAIVLEHARHLAARGAKVDIVGEKISEEIIRNVGATPVRIGSFGLTDLQRRRSFAKNVEKHLKRGAYDLVIGNGDLLRQDVVFLHNLVHLADEVIPGKPDNKVRTVGVIHDTFLKGRAFKLLIANSRMMKNELVRRYAIMEEQIAVVYPGNNLERFSLEHREVERPGAREELGVTPEESLVGLITSGNLEKRGIVPFFEALAALPAQAVSQVKVLVVGKDKDFSAYTNRLPPPLRERILYIKQSDHVEKLFYALDLFILPAYLEEFGLVVQEAMACGLPIVTTSRVGSSEILPESQSAYVLPDNDPGRIARALTRILGEKESWPRLGAENAKASRHNDWDVYNDTLITLYHDKLGIRIS